jgi:PAS domain S-box-containing protein
MNRYKILFAEDVPDDKELAEIELRRAGIDFESRRTETRSEFIELLSSFEPDVVISDYTMPNFNGMDALNIVLEKSPLTPVIIHTGSINEETAVKCMKAGAFDYVLKEKILRLPFALRDAYEKSMMLRKNMESAIALKVSQEKYKGLFNSIAQGVFYINNKGEISTINPAASRILFLKQNEKNTIESFHSAWELRSEDNEIFRLDSYINEIQVMQSLILIDKVFKATNIKYGEEKWLLINVLPQQVENISNPIEILVIVEDITGRKKAEDDLIQAKQRAEESDRLKTAFLANLSHEVRTPMNAILGFSELLSDLNKDDETEKFYIETIQNNSAKLLGIITDIIEISKIETGNVVIYSANFELSALNENIKELHLPTALSKGLNLYTQGFDPNVILTTDEQKLKKILSILVDNALKFTEKGQINVSCRLTPDTLQIHVIDTGCGIPAGMENLIYERFRQADETYSRKHGGTGLGLSIARAYAETLGGMISYESSENGSDFYLWIPIKWKFINTESLVKLEISNFPDYSNFTFIIAEDDATNFAFLTRLLSPTGAKIIYASNGLEAIEQLSEHPEVDLILMDIKMPIMDGYEATEKIRKTNSTTPIIATTAYAMSGDKEKCIAAGCNAYISKPLKKAELFDLLNKYLSNFKSFVS